MERRLLLQTNQLSERWKRKLDVLQQKNILQKNKLAEILKGNNDRKGLLLDVAEQYQNQFLQQDEAFRFMRNDISKLEKLLSESIDDIKWSQLCQQEEKMANEMKSLEMNFNKLSSDFTLLLSLGSFCL